MRCVLLFCLIFSQLYVAQNFSVQYVLNFAPNKNSKQISAKNYILNYTENKAYFFPESFVETNVSTLKETAGECFPSYLTSSYLGIFTKMDFKENTSIERIKFNIEGPYNLKENLHKISWKIHKETRNFENYKLRRATGEAYGRKWEVWYAENFNVNAGPFLLRDLPGLIFIAKDIDNEYAFELVEISEKTYDVNFLEEILNYDCLDSKVYVVNQKQLKNLMKEYYNDPFRVSTDKTKNEIIEERNRIANLNLINKNLEIIKSK